MKNRLNIIKSVAIVFAVAAAFCSCKSKTSSSNIDISKLPTQVVDSMNIYQSKNGVMTTRIFAPKLEKFTNDSLSYEYFPDGINVYAFTEDGLLESTIRADKAKHDIDNYDSNKDVWKAYGNVVINNVIKGEVMKTDTLYWDKDKDEIYTNCYVSLKNKDGFMQGYGMHSDQRGRNAVILKPFDSYTSLGRDTNKVHIDSVNFIGPILKK